MTQADVWSISAADWYCSEETALGNGLGAALGLGDAYPLARVGDGGIEVDSLAVGTTGRC